MKIEKVNGFWVPSNDIHIEQWKAGAPFTQSQCLNKFIKYCESQNKKMKTVIDIGAWCGTWAKAMEPFARKVIAFEPDKIHFACLQRNCTINCDPRMEAVGAEIGEISLTVDNFTQAKRVLEKGTIRMINLDCMNYQDVDMIKIDVEGYEGIIFESLIASLPKDFELLIIMENWFEHFPIKKFKSSNHKLSWYYFKKKKRLLHSIPFKLLGLSSSYQHELEELTEFSKNPHDIVCRISAC